jgi:hypothetical protein
MSLAEGKALIEVNESDFVDINGAVERWEQFPASVISDHGQACCRIAREWMLSMDYSLLNAGNLLTGPRWLRQQYKWGPSSWPIYWCEAVAEKTLDCGALAALAQKIFNARGVACYRAQLIQQYSEEAAHHWNRNWQGGDATVHWIKEDLIYHEACAVVVGADEIKIWDPTASWWVNPKQFGGYGGVLLLRVFATQTQPPAHFNWGAHRIVPNQWQKIERARGDFA